MIESTSQNKYSEDRRNTESTFLKNMINRITTVLIILIILLTTLLVGARLVGLQVFTVLSGSMEPAYKTGSIIYVRTVEPSEIAIGSPITFVLDESLTVATHRVIDIDESNQRFYTQGDANESADGAPVHFKNLLGTPVFTIPYLGYVANYIKSPPGMYFAVGGVIILLLLVFLPDLLSEEKKEQSKREK